MRETFVRIETAAGSRRVKLSDYLDAAREEQAAADAHAWIKALRHADVDGVPLRRLVTVRGDSLWWFTELYLHKTQAVLTVFRTIAALERLAERERLEALDYDSGPARLRTVVAAFAVSRTLRTTGRGARGFGRLELFRMDMRARALTLAARASRLRRHVGIATTDLPPTVAAFVHTAFWREHKSQGAAEAYIGPVLTALESRLPAGGVRYVGVGPSANFRARRWWHALRTRGRSPAIPIEALAPLAALRESRRVWSRRHALRKALWRSAAIRRHAVIRGCDCWPIIAAELAGVALLQWPWSARAMDEAAAALRALRPRVIVTYAEAGGWGRALVLEARRRGIPSAGLQHGFIYRHWLNYLHEADEMLADPGNPDDAGFPRPTLTLVYDAWAAQHLEKAGHMPPEALAITGSPRLDELVSAVGRLSESDVARVRERVGSSPGDVLALLATKYREAAAVLPALMAAVDAEPGVRLVIKTHPAETPDVYAPAAAGRARVSIVGAEAPLGPLLRACRAVVTVNSTVALDAAVLGVPALVIGLPNNLTPFVEAGVMAGARDGAAMGPALRRILYDGEFRLQLDRDRRAFLARFAIGADGRAAERSAAAVLGLVGG